MQTYVSACDVGTRCICTRMHMCMTVYCMYGVYGYISAHTNTCTCACVFVICICVLRGRHPRTPCTLICLSTHTNTHAYALSLACAKYQSLCMRVCVVFELDFVSRESARKREQEMKKARHRR